MTRICTWCKRVIGERCAECGAEATPVKAISQGHPLVGTDFDCPACGHHFTQGEGGETGGMCERCFDAELRRADERATKIRRR
jgi:hypothetical protein